MKPSGKNRQLTLTTLQPFTDISATPCRSSWQGSQCSHLDIDTLARTHRSKIEVFAFDTSLRTSMDCKASFEELLRCQHFKIC
jgi:hypothetical protein